MVTTSSVFVSNSHSPSSTHRWRLEREPRRAAESDTNTCATGSTPPVCGATSRSRWATQRVRGRSVRHSPRLQAKAIIVEEARALSATEATAAGAAARRTAADR